MNKELKYHAGRHVLTALAIFFVAAMFSVTTTADSYYDNLMERFAADGEISASEAKRIVRYFLTQRGYSSQMKPGGARVGKVNLEDGIWAIQIRLYGTSLANRQNSTVFIDTHTGLLAESRPEAGTFLAGVSGQEKD